jgi:hypothetical protein
MNVFANVYFPIRLHSRDCTRRNILKLIQYCIALIISCEVRRLIGKGTLVKSFP